MGWFTYRLAAALAVASICSGILRGQVPGPTSGEITVQLIQGLDSATNPRAMSQGRVTKSTSPAVPVGSTAMVGLASDPVNGGYTVKLLRLAINGQITPAASSDVVLAPDFFNKAQERMRAKGQPEDAVTGTRVFLPARMIIRLTLTTPTAETTNTVRPRRPEPQASENQPPTQPKGWVVEKLPEIGNPGQDVVQQAALLTGQTIMNGRTSGAYLVMHCDFPTTAYPGLLPLETILGGTNEMFDVPGAPGSFVDISDFTSSQLGDSKPIEVNANAQNRSNGARVRFFFEAQDMSRIVDAAGTTLKLSVGSGSSPTPTAVAVFVLPQDNSPVKQMMNSCLQKSSTDAEALQSKIVASCPVPKDGKILDSVALQYADGGKQIKGDMDEEDFGGVWKLPPPAKGHPARKVSMTCSYRDFGTSEGTPVTDKSSISIPETARSCEFVVHKNTLLNSGVCLSTAPLSAGVAGMQSQTPNQNAQVQPLRAQSGPSTDGGLPPGPIGPVNRLNVRGISVRMGRGQILAAAKAARMLVNSSSPQQIQLIDPTVKAPSGTAAYGLILNINFQNDVAVSVQIGEQGGAQGAAFEDICKKWGKPPHLPRGYDNELGTGDKATWGDRTSIYAEYNPSLYSYGGQTVTIYDAVALAPHPQVRKKVPM